MLINGGEHGVASQCPLSVGKSAHRHLVGHFQSHALGGVHDAYGCIIVHGKEGIRAVVAAEHFGRNQFGIITVVAGAHHTSIGIDVVLEQGIAPAVVSVLGYFQIHRRAIEGNAPATRADEVFNSREGSHVIVHHHTVGIQACANTVVKNQWQPPVDQFLEMGIFRCAFGLRHNDAAHLVVVERTAYLHLLLIPLLALRHHEPVATTARLFVDAAEH